MPPRVRRGASCHEPQPVILPLPVAASILQSATAMRRIVGNMLAQFAYKIGLMALIARISGSK